MPKTDAVTLQGEDKLKLKPGAEMSEMIADSGPAESVSLCKRQKYFHQKQMSVSNTLKYMNQCGHSIKLSARREKVVKHRSAVNDRNS